MHCCSNVFLECSSPSRIETTSLLQSQQQYDLVSKAKKKNYKKILLFSSTKSPKRTMFATMSLPPKDVHFLHVVSLKTCNITHGAITFSLFTFAPFNMLFGDHQIWEPRTFLSL
jgi:hypothetical protein